MHLKDGKFDMSVGHPNVQILADSFVQFFKEAGGINYVGLTVSDKETGDEYDLVMTKKNTKSMYEVNAELMAEIAALKKKHEKKEIIGNCCDGCCEDLTIDDIDTLYSETKFSCLKCGANLVAKYAFHKSLKEIRKLWDNKKEK